MDQLMEAERIINEHYPSVQQYHTPEYEARQDRNIQNFERPGDQHQHHEDEFINKDIHYDRYYEQAHQYQEQQLEQLQDQQDIQRYKIENEIRPYLDDILVDQEDNNKQIQRQVHNLKNVQQGVVGLQFKSKGAPPNDVSKEKTNYLLEIQRTVDNLIENADQERSDYKVSLQNLKDSVDNNYQQNRQEEQDYYSQKQVMEPQSDSQKLLQIHSSRRLNHIFQGISDLEDRLVNEIMALRQEKEEALNQVHMQRERYNQLEKRYRILEKQYNKLLNRHDGQFIQEDFSQIMNKSFRPSRSHVRFDHIKERPVKNERMRNPSKNPNNNIRSQISQLEEVLRVADQQRVELVRQINHAKQNSQPHNRFQQRIQGLNRDLQTSERKAAQLFPYKLDNDVLVKQLRELKAQNHHLRNKTFTKDYTQGNKGVHFNVSYVQSNPRIKRESYGARNVQKSKFAGNQDQLGHYRQVLEGLRDFRR